MDDAMRSVFRGRDTEAMRLRSQDKRNVASVSKAQPCGCLAAFENGIGGGSLRARRPVVDINPDTGEPEASSDEAAPPEVTSG